ncbi:MAG: hypothetical protein IIW73_05495 [Clostridia bacterium]|nr:hypothetical protein [Clostridia bacterium]
MYSLTSKIIKIEEKTAVTFGISCGTVSIDDISTDRGEMMCLIDKCNQLQLSPTHLFEVVEDFLNE